MNGKKNNGIQDQRHPPHLGGTCCITAVGDAFNVNDELNITGTTMTIDAKDGVKVDRILQLGPCTYPTTTPPSQQEMMASTHLETSSSIVVPTPSGIRQKDLKVRRHNGGDIIYSTDDGVNAIVKTPTE